MALNYLLDPVFQIENSAGKPATDGWLEVYIHGTRTKYYCASDFNGTLHPFKIPLDSLGSNIVLAEDGQAYDVYAYNRFGSLLMSRYNVTPGKGGGSGGNVGEMQHWLGMYGPTYTPFPGDLAGHTLGISKWEVDYVGDFIDRIETCPYPDGTTPQGYIYLKPGLYYVSCIIRYQQAADALSNTLDEILIYTGAGNANESLAYQMDSSGPEATGNRHNVRVQFIRRVPDNVSSGILYFAPGTPVAWKEAYIQKLEIIKLDSVALSPTIVQGLEKVHHNNTLRGDGTLLNPLSVDSDNVQMKLTAGEGIDIDSDGVIRCTSTGQTYTAGENISIDSDNVISATGLQKELTAGPGIELDSDGTISVDSDAIPSEPVDFTPLMAGHGITIEDSDGQTVISATGEVYNAGYGILIDSDNEISVDPDVIQEKLTAGDGIQIDSDGTITADLPEEEEVEFEELNLDDYQKKLTAGEHIYIDSDNVISATGLQKELIPGEGIDLDSDGNISVDQDIIPELPPILPLVAGDNVTIEDSDGLVVISAEGGEHYSAGEGINIDSDGTISADLPEEEEVQFEELDLDDYQKKLTAGQNITIDSDGVISATGGGTTYTAGNGIAIDSDGVISSGNLFVATFNVTPFDDIKAAIDAGKAVIARSGRIQYSVCSTVTELWGAPCIFFEAIIDQYQVGFPARSLVACRRISDASTEWRGMGGGELALQSNVNSALNAKQNKLTAGANITIDSDGVISATGGPSYTAGENIDIDSDGVISAPDVQKKLTAGEGINLDSDGNISVKVGFISL